MTTREEEIAKYVQCYKDPAYKMGDRRRRHIQWALERIDGGSLLDVSTGRGETLDMAAGLGFFPVHGTEAVPYLCNDNVTHALAHDLPFADNSFCTVTMFDVMEHLLRQDTEVVCKELQRVASKRVLLTVHNGPSRHGKVALHINRRDSYQDWHEELQSYFDGDVVWLDNQNSISEMFEVTLRP